MKFQLLSLTPAALPSKTACDWTQQELAEFYRVHDILLKAGLHVEFDRGLTDEGDPWCVFCRPPMGDVIIHFARCDGQYIVASSPFGAVIQGKDFRQIVDSFIARQPLILPGQRDGSSVFLHPTALLTALVATALFLLDQNEAEAAPTSLVPPSESTISSRPDEPSSGANGFTSLVHILLEPLRPHEQREALVAISAIVAGMASLNYASDQLPLINLRAALSDPDNVENAQQEVHDNALDVLSNEPARLTSKIGAETTTLQDNAPQGSESKLVIDLNFNQLRNAETQTLQDFLVKPIALSASSFTDVNLKSAEYAATETPFEALFFVAHGQTATDFKRASHESGGSTATGSAAENSATTTSASSVPHTVGASDGSNEARMQSQLASSVKHQLVFDETFSIKSSEVTVCVPGNVEKFHGIIFDSFASNLLRLASLPTLQTIDYEAFGKASQGLKTADISDKNWSFLKKDDRQDVALNQGESQGLALKQGGSQDVALIGSHGSVSNSLSASWPLESNANALQHNQATTTPFSTLASESSDKNLLRGAISDSVVVAVSSPDVEARAISALAHFMKTNPDFTITQKGRDIVLFENSLGPAEKVIGHVHSWDFQDGSRMTIIGSLSGLYDA